MARLDIKPVTEEQIKRVDEQVKLLGLKSRNEYFRLIMDLDVATNIIKTLRDLKLKK